MNIPNPPSIETVAAIKAAELGMIAVRHLVEHGTDTSGEAFSYIHKSQIAAIIDRDGVSTIVLKSGQTINCIYESASDIAARL